MFAPKKILVPSDFSVYSDRALNYAVDIASKYQSKILLVHVIDENLHYCNMDYCFSEDIVQQIKQESKEASEAALQKEIEQVKGNNWDVEIDKELREGIPYVEILRAQDENDIDLIVIASHGRSGLKKILLGSVAEKILRGAKRPVMLVRM